IVVPRPPDHGERLEADLSGLLDLCPIRKVEVPGIAAKLVFRIVGPGFVGEVCFGLALAFGRPDGNGVRLLLTRPSQRVNPRRKPGADEQRVDRVRSAQAAGGRNRQPDAAVHGYSIRSSGTRAIRSVISSNPTGRPSSSSTGSSLIRCSDNSA